MNTRSRRGWYGYVGLTGAAVMILEFAASRVIAPWFGSSIFVWGNIVGAVLIALSLGYYYGGRLADRYPSKHYLTAIVYSAGLFTACIPLFLFLLTKQLSLFDVWHDQTVFSTIAGSFFMIVVLFALPIGLLGMVSPFVIRLATDDVQHAGSVAGGLYAWSTIGSILGTFASAFFLVPAIGSRETILLAAGALLVIAVIGSGRITGGDKRRWWLLAGLCWPMVMYLFFGQQPLRANAAMLYETESPYQFIQVHDAADRLTLLFNDGLGTQSYYMKQGMLTDSYYDYLGLVPQLIAANSSGQPPSPHALVIGLAGGTLTRQLAHYFPDWKLTGVELDAAVIDIANRYFGLQQQPVTVVVNDGRVFLRGSDDRFDMIVLDAFAHEYYIPWHLTTQEFFMEVADHLTARGVMAMNIGSVSEETALFRALLATVHTVWPHVYVMVVPDTFNYIVVASATPLDERVFNEIQDERAATARRALHSWHEISSAVADPAFVLTDNRAPIELYTEHMIWKYLWDIAK